MKAIFAAVFIGLTPAAAQDGAVAYRVRGDTIPGSLTGRPGDPTRGANLVMDRHRSLCLLCHLGPFAEPHLQGNIAPDLSGVGSRLSEGQIRLRVVDMKSLNPNSLMPAYLSVPDRDDVAEAWRGRPILEAAEIDDIVAYLMTLRD